MYYFISTPVWLLCISYALSTLSAESKIKWPSSQQEALDEVNDAAIVKAVQQSMMEWSIKSHKHQRKKRAVKKVCYHEVGCFEDSGPFSYLEMLPSPPEEINTKFYFYSTKNRSERPLLELPFVNMTDAFRKSSNESSSEEGEETSAFTKFAYTLADMNGFDELSIRVIVHGFGSACPHVWIYEMKTALMAVENCIVICVDWENGATLPNYVRAAANTRLVGKQLSLLLKNLQKHKGLSLARTHIIGFSLGAHVAGFAGAELKKVNRITGLDPAGPLFESQHPKVRLDNTDAEFVDVIHSNGENLILGGLGSWQPMGHVDFYPNGGRVQTGCSNLFVGAITDFVWSQAAEVEGRSLCNHRRAYKFFIDSVAPRCQFPAFPCNSYEDFLRGNCFPCKKDGNDIEESKCGNMGYYANRSTGRGQLYLVTREEEPFCAHQFHIEIFNSFNDLPLRTIGKLEATLEGEGGLNETFLITEKEDTEFFAGDVVSKIIVPHPALGFPTSLTLQYKSYSGWLTKGLPHWDIDKVVLTDSYGRSHSLCKPSLLLSSGTPVHMHLLPGVCELPDETITTLPPPVTESTQSDENEDNGEDGVESIKNQKDILNLGANFKISKNRTYTLEANGNSYEILPWQPILEGNALDRDQIAESSRSLRSDDREVFEPILKSREDTENSSGTVKGRNLHVFDHGEVVEPVLKATTPKTRKVKELTHNKTESTTFSKSEEKGPMTVQLFPFRLGELLVRAERYARETLLPLISEQAPRFFGFGGGTSDKEPSDRKPRYIPRYEELAIKRSERRHDRREKDLIAAESRERKTKNILELVRPRHRKGSQQRSNSEVSYYANKVGKTFDLRIDGIELASDLKDPRQIRIDLPTYRPPLKKSVSDLVTTEKSLSAKQKTP